MNIGQAGRLSGVSAKMISYYEQIGLIPPAARSDAGYRNYTPPEVHRLRFIGRARDLGFTVEQISALLVLWHDRGRASGDVKSLALSHAAGLKTKIAELETMANTLEHLAAHCHGNERPDCPILADLAEPAPAAGQSLRAAQRAPRFGSDTPASARHRAAR